MAFALAALFAWAPPAAEAAETQFITSNLLTSAQFGNTPDDNASAFLPIGFNFNYGGVDYSNISISINGLLFFAHPGWPGDFINYDLNAGPNPEYAEYQGVNASTPAIFALWDDLYLGTGSNESLTRILHYTTGAPGSRIFIAQWTNAYSFGEPYEVGTFNVVLHEGSNKIEIYYRNMLGASPSRGYGNEATIGLQTGPSYHTQWSYHQPNATQGTLLTYTPTGDGNTPYTLNVQQVTPATTAAIPTYFLTHTNSPKVPVNLSSAPSTPSPTSAQLSWDLTELGAVPEHFRIRYANNPEFTGVSETGNILSTELPYTLNGLVPGNTYYFQIVAYEGSASSNSTVSQFTQAPNNIPVAANGSFSTERDVAYDGTLSATDTDNVPNTSGLIYSITTQPTHGTVTLTDSATGAYTYTPAADYDGPDSFVFKAFDGTAYSNEGTISVTVLGALAGPLAVNDTVTATTGGTRLYPLANDGDPATKIVSVSNPNVTISPDGRSVIAPEGFTGDFTYRASGGGTYAQGTVTVLAGSPIAAPRKYTGLLYDGEGKPSGLAVVTISTRGSATAQVRLGTTAASSKFAFPATATTGTGASALGEVNVIRNPNGTASITLAATGGSLTGTLRAAPTATTFRKYHVALKSVDPTIPGGGFLVVNVRASSATSVAGLLPDGRPFSSGSSVADNGTISFYGKQTSGVNPPGFLVGQLIAANLPTTDVTGEVYWNKPAQIIGAKGMHLTGVNTSLAANGSLYSGSLLPFTGAGTLALSGSTLASPQSLPVLVTNGFVQVPALPVKGWSNVRPAVGKFSVRVQAPGITRAVSGSGVFLPKSRSAWGYFPGTTVGGRVQLTLPLE